jgi:hypothetical protein
MKLLQPREKNKNPKIYEEKKKKKTFVLSKASFSSLKVSCHNEASNCL